MIIGLDVGGTHTDVVLLDKKGLVKDVKVPTDPSDLFNTVLTGLEKITEDIHHREITRVVLSTTLTTNAIAQKKMARVGMIVAGGPGIDPENYRTNGNYYTVSGSIDHRGREIQPVNTVEIQGVVERLIDAGIRHVGVVGKFSTRNPDHETTIGSILEDSFEKIFLGHQVSGNLNFPRRIATTFFKAAAYSAHKAFFESVKKSLDKKGFEIPIYILKADGGTISFEASIDYPGQTILSGPAASVMGATVFAPENEDVVVIDIGGTTTDIAVLINRVPVLEPLGIEISGYKTLIRALKTRSIGLGGDSAVKVNGGKLEIGPERLGPAMAFGGSSPTPTDALSVLGLIQNSDREKAVQGITPIAEAFGESVEKTASMIFDDSCREILHQVQDIVANINSKPVYTVHELMEGYQVKPEKILVLGGPAPYFAKRLDEMSDFRVDVVPAWHVANAIGAALARTTCEVSLFADTGKGLAVSPEEKFSNKVNRNYNKTEAVKDAGDLLNKKALQIGASAEDFEMEVVEHIQFNMVRGFSTTGKNIRVKVQVKPGIIHGYGSISIKQGK